MTWSKLDDGFYDHPKVLAAGNAAAGVFARAIAYANRQGTDGKLPEGAALMLAGSDGAAVLERLVSVGLLEHDGADYRIHDFHHYQPPAAAAKARRDMLSAARAEAGRRGAQKRWVNGAKAPGTPPPDGKPHGKGDGKHDGKTIAGRSQNDAPVPGPEGKTVAVSAETGTTARARDPGETAAADGSDRPIADIDAFDLVARLAERSGGRIRLTVIGAAEREFRQALRALDAQGWTLRGFDDWAACVAAGADSFWRGEYRTLELLGSVGDDGRRPATGLIRCLEAGREWRRHRDAEAVRRAQPVVKLVQPPPDLAAVGAGASEALAIIRGGRRE